MNFEGASNMLSTADLDISMSGDAPINPRRSARARRADKVSSVKRTRKSKISARKNQRPTLERHLGRAVEPELRPGNSASVRRRRSGFSTPRRSTGQHAAPVALTLSSTLLPPPSPARELIRKAQQTVSIETDWLGRRPFIMDVILNAKPSVTEYSEDILMDALELSQAALPRRHYEFNDQDSLDEYWADKAALWRGVTGDQMHYPPWQRYQVSAERSTASWQVDEDEDASVHLEGTSSFGSASPPGW